MHLLPSSRDRTQELHPCSAHRLYSLRNDIACRPPGAQVGTKSHGFSLWRDKVVMLSSEEGTVILVDLARAEARPQIVFRPLQSYACHAYSKAGVLVDARWKGKRTSPRGCGLSRRARS